jgi:hypothetical protein
MDTHYYLISHRAVGGGGLGGIGIIIIISLIQMQTNINNIIDNRANEQMKKFSVRSMYNTSSLCWIISSCSSRVFIWI